MPIDLDQKYEIIYAHEEQFAYALAGRVVKKPEVSVWMILIPILFIHHAYKINQYKEGVKSFAKGILAAKKKALDKAYQDVSSGREISYGPGDYFPDAELTTEHEKTLAQKQTTVIRIMELHYKALLNADGDSLPELLKTVYGTSGQYREYLNRLMKAEKALNQYLVETVHTSSDAAAIVKQIEENCENLRQEEMNQVFER